MLLLLLFPLVDHICTYVYMYVIHSFPFPLPTRVLLVQVLKLNCSWSKSQTASLSDLQISFPCHNEDITHTDTNIKMKLFNLFNRNANVRPLVREETAVEEEEETMKVVRLSKVLKLYGGQRHPKIVLCDAFLEKRQLVEWRFVPHGSIIIYVSHERIGTEHPDPVGTQMYHLLYTLERLQKGEISRTDMDAFHSLLYKHNHTTTAEEWKRILNSEKTYIWYDGFSVPRSRQEEGFRSIPSYIRRCDFMIILAPGCTHSDRIDPRTKRRMNLCYRTYRLRARCVFELFCAFLTTRGGEKARPVLLVRSGTGTPNWISALECQKLAVGTSRFECCEENHTTMKKCRRPLCLAILDRLIDERAHSLLKANRYEEARVTVCLKRWWLRGLKYMRKEIFSISTFKATLRWHQAIDGEWFDRCDFPVLLYASLNDRVCVVKELLESLPKNNASLRAKYLQSSIPKSGLASLGFTGQTSALHCAMAGASKEVVALLLKHGADPFETDVTGNDPFMFASIFGRPDNVKFWLNRFPGWDLERKNKIVGGFALGHAVYMGPNRLRLVKILLDHGASLNYITDHGSSILTDLCSSEDTDPEILQLVLGNIKKKSRVNFKRRGRTLKWRNIYRLARLLTRNKLINSGLMAALAQDSGSTALHYAVQREDVDVVNILVESGANPTITNDIGKTSVDCCEDFPELKGALKRLIQQRRGKGRKITTLHRRNSTATDMKFPMYLIPLNQLHRLYGGKNPRYERIEAHQVMKSRQELMRWEDLPIDAHIIFVSHEWVGWNHPDPHGIQLKTFLRVMKRLQCGEIERVDMTPFHRILFKQNESTTSDEWKEILDTAYVWFDWGSMPQPSACPPGTSNDEIDKLGVNLGKAVKSIPAYVEKSDFVAIVAPGCLHADRRDRETNLRTKTCYRTYRSRGWCVLEMFASYLSRYKTKPILLITSKEGKPEWVSSLEIQTLAVGTCDFTCCQRNHIFGDRTVPCDRGITRSILETLIDHKVKYFFEINDEMRARLCTCHKGWWVRTEESPKETCSESLDSFKKFLRWKTDDEWKDCGGVSILFYAVLRNDTEAVRLLISGSSGIEKDRINEYLFKDGLVEFSIPARVSALFCAMIISSVNIVRMLLESGADPKISDMNGADPFIYASVMGRVQNIKLWLSRFPRWNINRGTTLNGSSALHAAVYFGRNKLQTVQALVELGGADLNVLNHGGASVLSNAVDSVDSNVDVVRYLLSKRLKYGVNYRRQAQTTKYQFMYGLARGLLRTRVATSSLLLELAYESGATPLQYAAQRGDIEVVELLMEHGAEPSIKNDMGRDVLSYCKAFPEIKTAIERVKRENERVHGGISATATRETSHAGTVTSTTKRPKDFTLQRRLSTATSKKYDMYLLNITTMFVLFGDDEDRKDNIDICHQHLLEKGKLTRFEDLPLGTFVIFVSHQWNGFNHPDPNGRHIHVLCKTLRDLRDGVHEVVSTEPFSVLTYKQNVTTSASEWRELLSNAYIWFDFWCQPQPSMAKGTNEFHRLQNELRLAIESVASYVERSDTMIVLAPPCVHEDQIDARTGRKLFTGYRSWRRRGLCVLELFCAFLSRRKTHPVLLVRSAVDIPMWMSPMESLKLAVGESDFTCCDTNHRGYDGKTPMSCSRPIAATVINALIDAKIRDLLTKNAVVRIVFLFSLSLSLSFKTSHSHFTLLNITLRYIHVCLPLYVRIGFAVLSIRRNRTGVDQKSF